uniref:Uncharacterized protein n=1 Tax=Rhizophora mucronata TaxID=61149 RepID=A0A2P2QZD5_RHIMU
MGWKYSYLGCSITMEVYFCKLCHMQYIAYMGPGSFKF